MIHRERIDFPDYVYPADEWRFVEKKFYPRFLSATETLLSTANGYFGIRGTPEEGMPINSGATLVNGFYESWPIMYAENAFGFARTGQTIVQVPDTTIIKLYVDDEPFTLATANLIKFERALNMKEGTLDREVLWETPSGKQVQIKSRRLVSFEHRHLAAYTYEVTILNADAPILISSKLIHKQEEQKIKDDDPRKTRKFTHKVLNLENSLLKNQRIALGFLTTNSKMSLGCGIDHNVQTKNQFAYETTYEDEEGKVVYTINAKKGMPFKLTKMAAYHTSRRQVPDELYNRTRRTLDRGMKLGFDGVLKTQKAYMDDFWKRSDVQVKGDLAIQQAIRFNLYQICQATARAEGGGIPAKGLTGQGYEGHYFWDAEIYVMPFLIYTAPRIAKGLLKFRHSYLDKARQRAREVNQNGALFPWRTINGEEASAYYAAGTAQYHINADIAYALRKYVHVTGDEEFLFNEGVEILIETARLWVDLGFYPKRKNGYFCIHGVTGPDEYNTVVNNNTFTNLMARENMWFAVETIEKLKEKRPARYRAVIGELKVDEKEIAEWKKAADRMYVPFDEELGVHPQDEHFLEKQDWDFGNTPLNRYPILLHYHPLVIYRKKVIKQADVILAMFLLGNEFSDERKKKNFDFYDPLTTGDSSLSACIQGIMAFRVGEKEKGADYTRYAGLMDLADVAGNVKDGCHIASMGGFWMALVYGFAGMRDHGGNLTFKPTLVEGISSYKFPLHVKGQKLEVKVDGNKKTAIYSLLEGTRLNIIHEGKNINLVKGKPVTVKVNEIREVAKIKRQPAGTIK
jgi:alpha,alpha-trehalose phosphorylase